VLKERKDPWLRPATEISTGWWSDWQCGNRFVSNSTMEIYLPITFLRGPFRFLSCDMGFIISLALGRARQQCIYPRPRRPKGTLMQLLNSIPTVWSVPQGAMIHGEAFSAVETSVRLFTSAIFRGLTNYVLLSACSFAVAAAYDSFTWTYVRLIAFMAKERA